MKVYRGLAKVPSRFGPSAITIGNFVGVHRGHKAVIRRLVARARTVRAATTLVTFQPHPQKVLRGEAPCALAEEARNMKLLAEAGIRRVVVLKFDRVLSRVEPEEFIERILVQSLKAKTIVVGSDFTFGHFARGDLSMLRMFGRRLGYSVEGVRLQRLEGRRLSSTEIRHSLTEGDLAWVTKALDRHYDIHGRIVRGKGIGRRLLNFPTANLKLDPDVCLPKLGIYAGYVRLGRKHLPAAISVGTNPTFGENPLTVEAHILDFDGRLVGLEADFEFVQRLRDQRAFATPDSLALAVAADVEATWRVL